MLQENCAHLYYHLRRIFLLKKSKKNKRKTHSPPPHIHLSLSQRNNREYI